MFFVVNPPEHVHVSIISKLFRERGSVRESVQREEYSINS